MLLLIVLIEKHPISLLQFNAKQNIFVYGPDENVY